MSNTEKDLRTALVDMRRKLANTRLGKCSFLAPQALMPTSLIDRIVGLAHERKLPTLEALRTQLTWAFLDSHGPEIISLVQQFCPQALPSLFTTAPLAPRHHTVANTTAPVSKPSKQNKCTQCKQLGHNSMLHSLLYFSFLRAIAERTCHLNTGSSAQRTTGNENIAP